MNILRNLITLRAKFARFVETTNSPRTIQNIDCVPAQKKRLVVEALTERELLRVQGEEVVPFLQGLITNDMTILQNVSVPSMYAMFLNKAGRVLYDSIIYRAKEPNTYLIECDKHISNELRRHLRLFRVRREIKIDPADKEYRPWTIFNPDELGNEGRVENVINPFLHKEIISSPDPRLLVLGLRVITKADKSWKDLADIFSKQGEIAVTEASEEHNYRIHRYRYGVGEGVTDIPPGKCFPLESNCDFLHGVNFHKGCYIGQELTARVHHTGVVRKRIMPLRLTAPVLPNVTTVRTEAGAKVGTIRSVINGRALALMRVEQVLSANALMIDGDRCYVERPSWWPNDLPKNTMLREAY